MSVKVPASLLRALRREAAEHGVPPELLVAISWKESSFNHLAVGDLKAGVALGAGQLNLAGAGAAYLEEPWRLLVIDENAHAMAAYFRRCQDAYPADSERAISAYNQGVGGAARVDWYAVNGESYVAPVVEKWRECRESGVEEDWDPEVSEDFRQYGKTWRDVAISLKGNCDGVLGRLRQVRRFVDEQAGDL